MLANKFVQKLSGLTESRLQQSPRWSRPPRTRANMPREGDRPGPVFVLEGWAFRYKILPNGTRQVMAFLMPGDACDLHISMLAEMDHGIQTATPARLTTIGRVDMDRLITDHAAIARAMYSAQLIDEGTLRAWIVSMGRRTSIERVAHLICELYLRARIPRIAVSVQSVDKRLQRPHAELHSRPGQK